MSDELPVFANAKVQVPRLRPGLIERPRLEAALGSALQQRRVTLQAPAGFGKTSALTPDLPLARLRASDDLAEFRQGDLRFDEQEVEALMAVAGFAAERERVQELMQRTDGWAAGLRLRLSLAAPPQGSATVQLQASRHLFLTAASISSAARPRRPKRCR